MTPAELLRHLDEATLWPGGCGLTNEEALARALQVRALRVARGEQPRGFKIGFTNRTIWPRYGVHEPIWGTVWDTTLHLCEGEGTIQLAGTAQPRIEPECVFGLRAEPPPRADLQALRDCIDWFAPGFEIVQSHCADWRFTTADTLADSALHARLLVGRRIDAAALPADAQAFDAALAAAGVRLQRDGAEVERGTGANVLDGPLHALLHFVRALRGVAGAPALRAGDVVTTGTWTDAWPVQPGETWQAAFDAPLEPLTIRFE